MNPKKHKDFTNGIAEQVGVHQQVVDDFISFYYSKLRKKLSKLAYPRINVDGLGTFEIRKGKLETAIKKNKSMKTISGREAVEIAGNSPPFFFLNFDIR